MGPMFRDFCQKPTHLGGISPYRVSVEVPPGHTMFEVQSIHLQAALWMGMSLSQIKKPSF